MYETLTRAVQQAVETAQAGVRTSVPGVIVAYDAASNRATVRPAQPLHLANGEDLDAPNIMSVPVVFPASGVGGTQAGFTLPLQPGDGVELLFQQRSLDDWKSGSPLGYNDPRQFDITDAVALPGLNAGNVAGHPTDLVIHFGGATLTMRPDNSLTLGNDNGAIDIAADGVITLRCRSIVFDTPSNTFAAESHRHYDVQSGPSITGGPL